MPKGDKSQYIDKQKRQAAHIAEGYEHKGVPEATAEGRAWTAVNKDDGGGRKSGGSGRGKDVSAARSDSAKRAAAKPFAPST
jgi:hypothetical protein